MIKIWKQTVITCINFRSKHKSISYRVTIASGLLANNPVGNNEVAEVRMTGSKCATDWVKIFAHFKGCAKMCCNFVQNYTVRFQMFSLGFPVSFTALKIKRVGPTQYVFPIFV